MKPEKINIRREELIERIRAMEAGTPEALAMYKKERSENAIKRIYDEVKSAGNKDKSELLPTISPTYVPLGLVIPDRDYARFINSISGIDDKSMFSITLNELESRNIFIEAVVPYSGIDRDFVHLSEEGEPCKTYLTYVDVNDIANVIGCFASTSQTLKNTQVNFYFKVKTTYSLEHFT